MERNVAEFLPHITDARLAGLKPKKASAKRKTRSLFRIVRLDSPRDRFARRDDAGDGKGGWVLGHRVAVRGIFRSLTARDAHHGGPVDRPARVALERY